MKFSVIMCKCLSVSERVYVLFLIYRLFSKNLIIFVAAFILDVGRVIFGRGVYKIGFFFMYNILIVYLINCCIVKQLGFVSFSGSTIRLSNSDLCVLTIYRDCRDSLYVTLCYSSERFSSNNTNSLEKTSQTDTGYKPKLLK